MLAAALISIIISALLNYVFKKRETRDKLVTEYEYEQRKKLREIIGRYHGQLLNATVSLNYRFWNLYENHEEGWLDVKGDWSAEKYYFRSSVYRFLTVCALIRAFEKEALYVDARIAEKGDFQIKQYLSALHWCMTDVALFENLPSDKRNPVDHFYSDAFRQLGDSFLGKDNKPISLDEFEDRINRNKNWESALKFFDGLKMAENRLRWDRLVAFHLLLASFIEIIGYPEHRISDSELLTIARQVKNKPVLINLESWLPKHGLRGKLAESLKRACERVVRIRSNW